MSGSITGDGELKKQMERELRKLLEEDRPLRVLPRHRPDSQLRSRSGHTVPCEKLRQFQQFGHHAIFLIGDYTALIGDPSTRTAAAKSCRPRTFAANEEDLLRQAAESARSEQTEPAAQLRVARQTHVPEIIGLMSKFTVQEMLRRDNFVNGSAGQHDVLLSDRKSLDDACSWERERGRGWHGIVQPRST